MDDQTLNEVIALSVKAAAAHTKMMSDDGEQGRIAAAEYQELKAEIVCKAGAGQAVPKGFVMVPMHLTLEMQDVLSKEDWTWEDLLAAAEVITEEEHEAIARGMTATPAAVAQKAEDVIEIAARIFNFKPWKQDEEHKSKYLQFASEILFPAAARKMVAHGDCHQDSPNHEKQPVLPLPMRDKASAAVAQAPVALKTNGAWDGLEELDKLPDGTALYTSTYSTPPAAQAGVLKNAERYLVLRDQETGIQAMTGNNGQWGECGHRELYGEELDAAIDAAMKEKP